MALSAITVAAGSLAAVTSAFLCAVAFVKRRESKAALPFAGLMLANTVYAIAYTTEINSASLAGAIGWIKVEYFGVTFVPVFWYLFARSFVNPSRPNLLKRLLQLSVLPLITIGLMWTNEAHGLLYTTLSLSPGTSLSILTGGRGLWYWVNTAYLYILMLYGAITIVAQMSRAAGRFREQILAISAAVILPWVGHLLLILEISPYRLDLTPFLLTVSGLLLSWAVFKFGLFDLVPIAREMAVDAMRDALVVVDRKDRIVDANKAATAIYQPFGDIGADAVSAFGALGLKVLAGGETSEFSILGPGGPRHYKAECLEIWDEPKPHRAASESPRGKVIIISDTTKELNLVMSLETLVSTDQLTGVDNRRRFFEHAERELDLAARTGRAISFAMMDLDEFKKVNDTYGHAAGDAALVSLCRTCREGLRSSDFLCRFGGEEFMLILPETTPLQALEVIERLREGIAASVVEFEGARFGITASFGIAGSPGPGVEAVATYIRRADEAMYRAKDAGRNRVELFLPPVSEGDPSGSPEE